jgi:hypothetical protein
MKMGPSPDVEWALMDVVHVSLDQSEPATSSCSSNLSRIDFASLGHEGCTDSSVQAYSMTWSSGLQLEVRDGRGLGPPHVTITRMQARSDWSEMLPFRKRRE